MKILRIISSTNPINGGPINGLLNSSAELVARGHEVTVLSLDDPFDRHVASFPFRLITYKSSLGALKYSSQLKLWLQENVTNFDVVVIHGIWQYHSYAAAKACIKHNVPYVLFTHGMLDPWFTENNLLGRLKKTLYWKLFERHSINNAAQVLFTSKEELRLAREPFSPYSPNEKVVAYGSPVPLVNEEKAKKVFFDSFPHLNNKPFILFLSRIHEKKGIDLLIEAMGELNDKYPQMQLAIAGPDHNKLQPQLQDRATSLNIQKRISWLGMLDADIKWGAFYACEAFVLPSHQENFGIVVSEALSTGTPVLITNKVNIWTEVVDAKAGFADADSVSGVRSTLNSWWSLDSDNKLEMKQNALNCYKQNFSMKAAVDDLERVLISTAELATQNEPKCIHSAEHN
ncbi:glycosyltransferase [Aliiglaciecola sp. 2_MG-2023]|uniref:glycosyltransferase n=1 Tax=unclassified Aliiglaciecola TaxID=2593648 RepID=UPI0026E1685D|nr:MULTISPECIES: glycosyltransferase [unclassified Aliiglaciecola]MDO6712879.1 glycosyltransferase [Aliiglaciecola sp. 2_MG-2023]MDO6752885.1 glycosyltransferase [Aliiglaciecola sp. 1_MG-2023]